LARDSTGLVPKDPQRCLTLTLLQVLSLAKDRSRSAVQRQALLLFNMHVVSSQHSNVFTKFKVEHGFVWKWCISYSNGLSPCSPLKLLFVDLCQVSDEMVQLQKSTKVRSWKIRPKGRWMGSLRPETWRFLDVSWGFLGFNKQTLGILDDFTIWSIWFHRISPTKIRIESMILGESEPLFVGKWVNKNLLIHQFSPLYLGCCEQPC
jgi:hypothetical protein